VLVVGPWSILDQIVAKVATNLLSYTGLVSEPLATRAAGQDLSRRILDPGRMHFVVGVSLQSDRISALLDVESLRQRLGDGVEIVTVRTGEATWELKRALPAGLDLYGDAVRVWPPGLAALPSTDPRQGSGGLVLLADEGRGEDVDRVVELVGEPAREVAALVVAVRPDRATLRLVDGVSVWVDRDQITRHDLAVTQVLRAAQTIRVVVYPSVREDGTHVGSVLPFEPDPRARFAESYGVGSGLLGRVCRVREHAAVVELLPGVKGHLRLERPYGVRESNVEGGVAPGELIPVRVEKVEGDRIRLSQGEQSVEAARIYPDGPPWLAPIVATELPGVDPDGDIDRPRPPDLDRTSDDIHLTELEQLESVILRAADAQARFRELTEQSTEQVVRLRAESDRLRHELEMDLVEFRDRVLRSAESEYADLEGSTAAVLEASRAEVRRLRGLLATIEDERDDLRERLRETMRANSEHRRDLRAARADIARQRARVRALDEEMETFVPAADRLRASIRQSWLQHSTKADRDRFEWRDPIIGPEFARTLSSLEGVSRERVIDVCAEVASGRAATRPGLQVHPLRSASSGASAQRVREDGARAFRASLQVRSAAARRLHYWLLPDGQVELAKVGYHDDFTIR